MSNHKTPSIRFKGFTDDWEQRKLGEVIRLNGRIGFRGYTEKDIVSKDDGGVLTFSPTNIVDNKLTTNCKNTYITRFKYDESPEIKIHNGDILFVKTGSTLGKCALVTGLSEDATLNPQVVVMRTNNLNAEFLAAMLVTNTIISQVNSAKIGGAVPTLTETRIKDFDVAISVSEAEKEQIGQFFSQLDNLITLHQRKYEKLVNVKKSMLDKMFPKNAEKIPEIRFKGFNDDWEQRKLSDCAGFRRGSFPQPYGNKKWYDGEGSMPFVQVADVSNDMKLVNDTKQKISKLAQPMSVFAEKGSILVTLQGSIGRVAITQYGAFVDRTVLIFDKYKEDIDKRFWAYIIKEKFEDEARKAPGGTIKTITKEALSDFDLMLPCYTEQNKLADYLLNLDNLITLHQRELEKLQNLKKSLLNSMFI